MICNHCQSAHTVKNGINSQGLQNYICRDCGGQSSSTKRPGRPFGTTKPKAPCNVCGDRLARAKGMCDRCYRRAKKKIVS